MHISRILALLATVCFLIAFVLVAIAHNNLKLATDLAYAGFALFAGSHCID